ncbi:MAG: ubiquinol-cytochrome c reductase iron-sulfur subunit [Bryobacterales bacterium]|nr:ubiquinol-cytochrome c reductase iron-sulfur subunit [Bryobacterales bacterium]
MAESRRSWLERAIYAMGGILGAALAVPAAAYLFVPPRSKKSSGWIEVAEVERLPLKSAEEVVFRHTRADGWKVTTEKATAWLVKTGDNEVTAFAPQCTHLGCVYSFDNAKSQFVCPCHTSAFSLDGQVLAGPAPRPLDQFVVKVENGKVLLGGTDKPVKA